MAPHCLHSGPPAGGGGAALLLFSLQQALALLQRTPYVAQ